MTKDLIQLLKFFFTKYNYQCAWEANSTLVLTSDHNCGDVMVVFKVFQQIIPAAKKVLHINLYFSNAVKVLQATTTY